MGKKVCGLIAVIRKDGMPAAKSVAKRYQKQKTRGQLGFGYVAIIDNVVVSWQRATTEHEILFKLSQETAPEIWFHHRQPTSTPNIEESAHPLLIRNPKLLDYEYFILHNGVIRNDEELRDTHIKSGFTYETEVEEAYITRRNKHYRWDYKWNDSESLAIETALALEGKKTFIGTEGPAAVLGLQVKKGVVVQRFFYRNIANPLVYENDSTMVTLTSIGKGRDVKTERVWGLDEFGEVMPIDPIVTTPPSYKPTYPIAPSRSYSDHEDLPPIHWEDDEKPLWERYDPQAEIARQIGFTLGQEGPMLPRGSGPSIFPQDAVHVSLLLPAKQKDDKDHSNKPLNELTPDELWAENDALIGLIREAEQDVEDADEVLRIDGHVSNSDYEYAQNLHRKLENMQRRFRGVDALITALIDNNSAKRDDERV